MPDLPDNGTQDQTSDDSNNNAVRSSYVQNNDTSNVQTTSTPPVDVTAASNSPAFGLSSETFSEDTSTKSPKAIATILGIVLLVAGVAAGVLLVNRNAEVRIKAWDCVNYVFEISEDGVVSVRNGSTRNEPLQKAQIKINGSLVATLDVPALEAGDAATLGTVPVPEEGFSWEIIGTKDCENSGTYGSETLTPTETSSPIQAQCNEVIAYDEDWNVLSTDELSHLKEGDVVRFAINGTATSGTFDKARFTINGTLRPEVTTQRPGSTDYYDEYTIPAGESVFEVSAEIFHSELGWL